MEDEKTTETTATPTETVAAAPTETPAPAPTPDPTPAPTTQDAPTPATPTLAPGRVVLYTAIGGGRVGMRLGLEGGRAYPATVVRVFSDTCATIAVLSESQECPIHTIESVNYDATGAEGTWAWPVRS